MGWWGMGYTGGGELGSGGRVGVGSGVWGGEGGGGRLGSGGRKGLEEGEADRQGSFSGPQFLL